MYEFGENRNLNCQNCTVQKGSDISVPNDNRNLKTIWEKVLNDCPLVLCSSLTNSTTVHGSLARAGKVKAATPKVDKQEKKKSPKGRAKKRILYNRRCVSMSPWIRSRTDYSLISFVNVTTLPGGKRRM